MKAEANWPLWAQTAANLFSLLLALTLGWSPELILFLFWAENLVIGAWQLPRFFLAQSPMPTASTSQRLAAALPLAIFFTLHYGLFTFVHGVFLFELIMHYPFDPAGLQGLMTENPALLWALLGIFVSHGIHFAQDLGNGRLQSTPLRHVMGEPYQRIVIMHLVILASAFALQAFPYPLISVMLLSAIKIGFDIYNAKHSREIPQGGKRYGP